MFCPGCGLQVSDDLKFCKQCGANLHGAREGMMSRSVEKKFDWSKTWVADMFLTEEERERRRGVTAEKKWLNEIKGGVVTSFVGVGVMLFLRFFLEVVAKQQPPAEAEILRHVWLVGIIPFMVGLGIIFNGLFITRRIVKLKEKRAQIKASPSQAPATLPAKTTNHLVVDAAPSSGASVIEDTTAHFPEPAAGPSAVKPIKEDQAMFCPGCGIQADDDLKFCKRCGANLRSAREAMASSFTDEKFDWNKAWVESLPEEARKRLSHTPEGKQLNDIKEGVLTIFTGIGTMIFLHFLFDAVAKKAGDGAEIIRSLYWLGIVVVLVGAGMIFNGLFISQRLLKPKERQAQPSLFESPAEVAYPLAAPAKTTDQLVANAARPADTGVTEDTTAHLP
ncbi:MAG: zinc ribbon domain-containing protein [Chloracidobacterium sp.]|nr:zinc ribbon domain-containing protein [Chloracidobacterium sp.]